MGVSARASPYKTRNFVPYFFSSFAVYDLRLTYGIINTNDIIIKHQYICITLMESIKIYVIANVMN
jgi:hypothetical protein